MEKNSTVSKNLKNIILAAMFAALIFIACFLSIPIPGTGGYVHLADSLIYIASCLLPMPYAMAAAAIGAAGADAALGYHIYIFGTAIIKPIYVLFFSRKSEKILTFKHVVGTIFAGLACVLGYYLYDAIIVIKENGFIAALGNIPWNLMQAGGSIVIFILLSATLDKIKIRRYL